MTTPTPPAVTADGLAAALGLIDRHIAFSALLGEDPLTAAVFAYARGVLARTEANERYCAPGHSPAERAAIDAECEAAERPVEDALAALCALATATGHATATAGEAPR